MNLRCLYRHDWEATSVYDPEDSAGYVVISCTRCGRKPTVPIRTEEP